MIEKLSEKSQQYYEAPRREIVPFIPNNARRILEVGCGDGCFGAELKRARTSQGIEIDITGIELNPVHAEKAKDRLDRVLNANIEHDNLGLADHSFDLVICNDVLEHLVSPWQVLKSLRSLLVPGGSLVASIPNVRYWGVLKDLLIHGDWRYREDGVLDQTHLRFFTRASIARMFNETNFSEIEITGINSHVRGGKFTLLRLLTGGRLDDIQFMQFAVVAKKPKE